MIGLAQASHFRPLGPKFLKAIHMPLSLFSGENITKYTINRYKIFARIKKFFSFMKIKN